MCCNDEEDGKRENVGIPKAKKTDRENMRAYLDGLETREAPGSNHADMQ